MSLELLFKNELGEVLMQGGGKGDIRILKLEGFGPAVIDYNSAVYTGYDGQETLDSRAAARCITIALEVMSENITQVVRDALRVFSQSGMLYIKNEDLDRRIYCSQAQLPDVTRVLRGQIATFTVQFVCDSPYFEDAAATTVPLYKRTKLLSTPFTLPTMFGEIVLGGNIEIKGTISVEPIVTIYYPTALEGAESIILTNETTGKRIQLDYAPQADDTVMVDVKNRKIHSALSGNLINYLTNDSFLGDFVFVRGVNVISVNVGDVTSGFTIECKYNNLYNEAVIV